jgi:predicted exporter
VIRKLRPAIVLWLAVVSVAVIVIIGTRFSSDMSAFLPRHPSPGQQVLVDQIQNGAASRLILTAVENVPLPVLTALSRNFAQKLRGSDSFALVNNGDQTDAAGIGGDADRDFLWRNRYLLSPQITPSRFTTSGLHQVLEDDLQLLSSNLGALVKRSLGSDPTGEILAIIGQFTAEAQPSSRDGVWVSRDERRALLLVQTRAAGFDIAAQEHALDELDHAFVEARQETKGADMARLRATGPPVFAVHTKTEMKEDVSRLSMIATIMVAALLLAVYRSPRILVLALVPVASGALAGIAAVSLGFGFVHGITLGFGVTLIGEAVDYAIYLFTQTAPGAPPEATLPRIWPLLQLGVLISICGFSAMLFSSFTGFAQLGFFSITGLIVAVAVTRWVLPSLVSRKFTGARSSAIAPHLLRAGRNARRLTIPLVIGAVLALGVLAAHRGSFWQDDLTSLSPIPRADQDLDRSLRADIGASDLRYLVIANGSDEQSVLAKSELLSQTLEPLIGRGVVASFDSPSRYLPSDATQQARRNALPEPDVLRVRLASALEGLPFQPDLFEGFIADVGTARAQPLLDRSRLSGTSLALKLDSLLFQRKDGWTAMLSLRGVTDPTAIATAIGALAQPDVIFIDLKTESDRLLEQYRDEAVMLAVVGCVVILVLLVASLHSVRRVALVAAPLALAVIVTTALLTLGDHRLSIFNLIGLLLTVAVGSNYCIFLERQDWNGPAGERTMASLVLANLCTVIGFGILTFSRLPVLHGIGLTVAIGAFLSLVFSAVITSRVALR